MTVLVLFYNDTSQKVHRKRLVWFEYCITTHSFNFTHSKFLLKSIPEVYLRSNDYLKAYLNLQCWKGGSNFSKLTKKNLINIFYCFVHPRRFEIQDTFLEICIQMLTLNPLFISSG